MTKAEKIQVLRDIAEGRVVIDTSPAIYIVEMVKGSDMLYVNGVLYSQFEYDGLLQYNLDNGINVPSFVCCRDYGKFRTKEAFEAYRNKENKRKRRLRNKRQLEAQEAVMHPVEVLVREEPKEAKFEVPKPQEIPTSGLISEYGQVWRFKSSKRPLNN